MKNVITDIQRFSLNDGPGIRTTVFFQGCNLRCPWCHNPETIPLRPVLNFYEAKCIGCGKCFEICPQKAHQMENGRHIVRKDLCVNCGECAGSCFSEALVMSGREMTAREVMDEIRQDKLYYEESGGGVTFSGGEALCQPDFTAELAEACRREGIPTAVETNMCHPFETMLPILKKMDVIMLDVKLIDEQEHRRWTGVSNRMVLENIRKTDDLGIPIILRTPLIPGVTIERENLRGIAKFAGALKNILYYELLNFNPLGEAKYRSLRQENEFEQARPLSKARLTELASWLEDIPVQVKIK